MASIFQPLRIIYMGTPDFAVLPLQTLVDVGHTICAVYSQPPRPAGRGQKIQQSAVHTFAENHKLPVLTPLNFKSAVDQDIFREHQADIAVVAAYGLILNQTILGIPRLGCINIHASLLPRWRGAAPIQRALLAGDMETGITTMQMDVGLDTGDILLKHSIPIAGYTTAVSLHDQLSQLGATMIIETLAQLQAGQLTRRIQSKEGVTYAAKLRKEEGYLDWHNDAVSIGRQVRALNPWPGTYFTHRDETIKINEVEIVDHNGYAAPGTVLNDRLLIACGQHAIRPLKLQRPGKAWMNTQSFLQSLPISQGTLLHGLDL